MLGCFFHAIENVAQQQQQLSQQAQSSMTFQPMQNAGMQQFVMPDGAQYSMEQQQQWMQMAAQANGMSGHHMNGHQQIEATGPSGQI